ncbi:ATP-binding protein [Streptomyces sp. NPDC001508]|uniref:ATP-binding protein n=1 Tax=Streptomyces sp. NPDC001508 TaxID=3154656 RepID=UPI00331C8B69
MNHDNCLPRSELQIPFEARPNEVPALRRIIRQHLGHWGLIGMVEPAQLCVSELATNVIKHVGFGVSATLAVSMAGTNLRLEVQDPFANQLPMAVQSDDHAEDGRGLTLIDAVSERWGVRLISEGKAIWCELVTTLTTPHGHISDRRVSRADELLTAYGKQVCCPGSPGVPPVVEGGDGAVGLIADLLHWVAAHGLDPDSILDQAQSCFKAASGQLS